MDPITRRSFLKKTACVTGGVLVSQAPLTVLAQSNPQAPSAPEIKPDLVAVKGKDLYGSALWAVQELGGIEAFVKRGDRVGVLVNSPFKNIGASVNPDVALAVLENRLREGRRINVEIYEMLSPESARRIHHRKAGDKGTPVPLGDEAAVEDYYVNFRKGAYQVTLSGYDTRKETLEWILRMARLVAGRIPTSAGTP